MNSDVWETFKLADICTKIGSGATPRGGKKAYQDKGPYALIRSQNVLDYFFSKEGLARINEDQATQLNNVTVEKRDVLLNITGDSVARVCQVPNELLPARVNQHVSIIRPDPSILNPEFLKYYLLNPKFKNFMLGLASVGGTRNALTKGMIEDFIVHVPPLSIQQRISEIISSLDEKIELNRKTNATLEAIADAIFKEWFVDFNFPDASGEMVKSELGLIPKEWHIRKLSELAIKITKGTTPTTLGDNFVESGVRFIRVDCIRDEIGLDETKSLFISSQTHEKLKRSQLFNNDILITIAGTIGRICLVPERSLPANINQAIGLIRINPKHVPFTYVFGYLKQKKVKDKLLSGITQSVQANISLSDLNSLDIIVPPKSLVEKFDDISCTIQNQIDSHNEQINSLSTIRDELLSPLMNGEIEV